MMDAPIRAALISILKAKRRKLNPAIRKRRSKPTTWLYPKTTEAHYSKAIRAWFRPMKTYVKKYLAEHSEAILHGDSDTAVLRTDATTGRAFNIMVQSLDAWVGQHFSDDPQRRRESPVYAGLTDIAKTVFDFNEAQYKKSTKEGLGIDFPINEDWWPDARDQWAYNNYWYLQKYSREWVRSVDNLTERAVTGGWSLSTLTKEIMATDDKMLENKARFLARDQIGKLNGQITQHRMEAAGLSMYIWSTSGDERVRGDPSGFYPDAEPSHHVMDGKLCRWDDPTVYSEDDGKTWIDRPYDAVKLHPGEDFNCRCTALAYWSEIVDEVDEQLEESDYYPPELSMMGKVPAPAGNTPQEMNLHPKPRISNGLAANQALANKTFPKETWVKSDSIKLNHEQMPDGATGIIVAKSKLPTNLQEELDLLKEIKSGIILQKRGSSVTLIPKIKDPITGKFLSGPDAIVDGSFFEFKEVTGGVRRIGARFMESRDQGDNVYIRVANENLSKRQVFGYFSKFVNDKNYKGGYKGNIIFSFGTEEKTYFFKIRDFKKP
jgi:uncharacterized protein with gpF-like domain